MRYIVYPEDGSTAGRLGGKAAALAALHRTGLPIPDWFVLSPEAFYASLSETQRRVLESPMEHASALPEIGQLRPASHVLEELEVALGRLCPTGERVAVRSSAGDEDGAQHSFAGQLDSFLFVHPSDVADRVVAVWRSGFSRRVLAYRRQQGLSPSPRPPAVLVQRMVNPDRSGVAFGADPVTGRRGVAVVAAVYGLGTALVSGEGAADTYHVDRQGRILLRDIADKHLAYRPAPDSAEGFRSTGVSAEEAKRPALTDGQVHAVAELARQTGRCFARPQDIEWAIEDGRLYLLQSRPITSLTGMTDPDGVLNLWDNSNVAESYGGVTTPLTFSFARRAYEEVYRQFCRLMGVPAETIDACDDTFRRMLGLIRGRVYYNLLSWYRLLAMLPGFTVNRRFMEQMMGVREPLPEELLEEVSRATWRDYLRDSLHLLRTLASLLANQVLLRWRIRRFSSRLEAALGVGRVRLEDLRADELAEYYHQLERQLLTRWDAPLINDFFAMIFHGLLRRLTVKWCNDPQGTLQNDLLSGTGRLISAEPVDRMQEMARIAAGNTDFVALLCEGSLDAILGAMDGVPLFKARYLDYLDRFGDRCLEELKLESPTLHEDPLMLLRAVGRLVHRCGPSDPAVPSRTEGNGGARGEERAREALAGRPVRRLLFQWVLRNARARVRDRENLRFERTRLFGRVRRIFLEFGRRFSELGLLEEPRDIFYLEVNEITGLVEGTGTSGNLKGLVALRKAEYEGYRQSEAPPDRFATRGIVDFANILPQHGKEPEPSGEDHRKGIACCRGIVCGPARVITDPRNAVLRHGEILVAERTDPGWITLFPSAAGLLVERGSLLSHSAIVARELGIPSVISIPGLTRWIRDGDWVELDGGSGEVRRVRPPVGVMADAQ